MSTGSVGKTIRSALHASTSLWGSTIASSSRYVAAQKPSSRRALLADCTCSPRSYSSYPSASVPSGPRPRRKRTILDLESMMQKGVPITMLTAHDYSSARFIESSSVAAPASSELPTSPTTKPPPRGIDICLVGDSLAMVACGYENTTSLTLDELLYHCRSVARGCKTSLLISDMPFGSYIASSSIGVSNAVRIIQEGNMDAVKIEGGKEIVSLVKKLVDGGIPVMGHVGLTPQRQSALSGYRVQGKTASSAMAVLHDALAIQQAGAFAILLEAVPARLAEFITARLDVPTIGIGAGKGCSGQVLVQLDMLGVSSLEKGPRFLKKYEEWEGKATAAIGRYVEDVRVGSYPEEKHGYPMPDAEWEGFLQAIKAEDAAKK